MDFFVVCAKLLTNFPAAVIMLMLENIVEILSSDTCVSVETVIV